MHNLQVLNKTQLKRITICETVCLILNDVFKLKLKPGKNISKHFHKLSHF
jgi:hypothetical protein